MTDNFESDSQTCSELLQAFEGHLIANAYHMDLVHSGQQRARFPQSAIGRRAVFPSDKRGLQRQLIYAMLDA